MRMPRYVVSLEVVQQPSSREYCKMIFGRNLVKTQRSGCATSASRSCTCCSSSFLLLCATYLLLLGLSAQETLCQLTLGEQSLENKETIPNTKYKLQNLHKQGDSGPQWLDIVKARGFIGELYTSVSGDSTPLSIYRIINPLANQRTLNKYPVLIFHGIGSDAAQMISHSETSSPRAPILGEVTDDSTDTSLGFMLANNNFDVWMCDSRGSNLNNHLVSDDLNPNQSQKFWNFSLDEQVHYDLPGIIDFILMETHEDKIHYVSYSQSTYFMFALLSSQIEYQDKLASFTAFAPVAYVSHIRGFALTQFSPAVLVPDSYNGNYIPQLYSDTVSVTMRQLCQIYVFTRTICPLVTSGISGKGDNSVSNSFYGAAIKSTSIKAVKHFLQQYSKKRMAMYDYGIAGNMRQYGQPTSPEYHLENIKMPSIALIRGGNDFLSTYPDQQRLLAELGTRPYLDLYYPNYNHVDMLVGRNVVKEVNLPTLRVIYDWTREWALREGSTTMLKDPVKALLEKPVAPVAVSVPDGSRKITIGSNVVNNLINGVVQTTGKDIVKVDGGEQLLSVPVGEPSENSRNPLAALTGKLNSMLPFLG